MEKTEANIAWAMGTLAELSHLKGFPQNEPALRGVAKAFLSIVGDRPGGKFEVDPGPDAERGERKYETFPTIPYQETVAWLMEQLHERFTVFPLPYQMRQVYEEKYTPADGKRTQTMGVL